MSHNPLLERIKLPGATFKLPSRCKFYDDTVVDEAALESGEVYVSPMTTLDELTIKSVDKLLNGTAITEVFARCIPQIRSPDKLLARDVDFLVVALRTISYGPTYTERVKHTCKGAKFHNYTISTDDMIQRSVDLNESDIASKYVVKLAVPGGEMLVKLRPLRYADQIKMQLMLDGYQRLVTKREEAQQAGEVPMSLVKDLEKQTMDYYMETIKSVAESVDGINDPKLIAEWAAALPISLKYELFEAIEALPTFGVDTSATVECLDCGEHMKVQVEINPVSFFTKRSSRATQNT